MKLSRLIEVLTALSAASVDDPEIRLRLIDHDDVTVHWSPVYEVLLAESPLGPEAIISGVPQEIAERLELNE